MAKHYAAFNHEDYAEISLTGPRARSTFARFSLLVAQLDLCGMNVNHPVGDYWVLLCKLPNGHSGPHGFQKHFYAALGLADDFGISLVREDSIKKVD